MHWSELVRELVHSYHWISSSQEQVSAWKICLSQTQVLELGVGVPRLNVKT